MGLETFEVWAEKAGGLWVRIGFDRGGEEQDLFEEQKEAEDAARKVAELEDTVEAVVIERQPCFRLNGPAVRNQKPPPPRPNLRLLDDIVEKRVRDEKGAGE